MQYGTGVTYRVFVRNWWRRIGPHDGPAWLGRVPNPGARKTTLARRCTEEEARAICAEYARTHEPGLLSRKAEYERE